MVAPNHGFPDFWFVADGYVLNQFVYAMTPPDIEMLTEDDTVAGQSWQGFDFVGVKKWAGGLQMFYEDQALASDAAFLNKTTARILMYGMEGMTVGKRFTGVAGAIGIHYKVLPKRHELHKADVTFEGSGNVDTGPLLYREVLTGASGNSVYVDDLVAPATTSPSGGAGYLEILQLALGGYTSVTIKIQHSVDHVTWADLITFTNVTVSQTAQYKVVAGTVNRYLRATYLFNGAGTGQSISLFCGFGRR